MVVQIYGPDPSRFQAQIHSAGNASLGYLTQQFVAEAQSGCRDSAIDAIRYFYSTGSVKRGEAKSC